MMSIVVLEEMKDGHVAAYIYSDKVEIIRNRRKENQIPYDQEVIVVLPLIWIDKIMEG